MNTTMRITVFTNGCFDLFHAGHARFLRQCRDLGDRLVVGLNTDNSVRRLKGPTRPICALAERMEVLRACRYVDEVIPFDDLTPCRLVSQLRPGIIVKGPGYSITNMPEAAIATRYGGQVIVLDGAPMSTSEIITRITSRTSAGIASKTVCAMPMHLSTK